MFKKIHSTVFTLAVVLTSIFQTVPAFASKPTLDEFIDITPSVNIKFATPFHVNVDWEFASVHGVASVDVTLTNGIDLISGDLHWEGENKPDSVYYKDLVVEITKPGTYEILAIFNAPKIQNQVQNSIFLYASKDTIAVFGNRKEMEQAIKFDQIIPEEQLEARYQKRVWEKHKEELRAKNTPRLTASGSIATIVYVNLCFTLDSINKSNLNQFYTPEQVSLIKKYWLLFAPPSLERIRDFMVNGDWLPELTNSQIDSLAQLVYRQANETYELDQRIIKSIQPKEREQLLSERYTLQGNQIKVRSAAVDAVAPMKH